MQDGGDERCHELCIRISQEKNTNELLILIDQLIEELEKQGARNRPSLAVPSQQGNRE